MELGAGGKKEKIKNNTWKKPRVVAAESEGEAGRGWQGCEYRGVSSFPGGTERVLCARCGTSPFPVAAAHVGVVF